MTEDEIRKLAEEAFRKEFGTRSDYFNHRLGLFDDMEKWVGERVRAGFLAAQKKGDEESRKLIEQFIALIRNMHKPEYASFSVNGKRIDGYELEEIKEEIGLKFKSSSFFIRCCLGHIYNRWSS
jgi:hypothetical protein